jgi:hypothetical protein
MHVPFKIHYRNNLIDKKNSYPIPRPPSWDDRNYSYGSISFTPVKKGPYLAQYKGFVFIIQNGTLLKKMFSKSCF